MDDKVDMTAFYVLLPFMVVGGILLVWFLFKAAGVPCSVCGDPHMKPMASLPEYLQQDIRDYFRQMENRECRPVEVFVCTKCKTVHDDFSGERRSRDLDAVGLDCAGTSSFCKSCGVLMLYEARPDAGIVCRRCGTPQVWRAFGENQLLFFAPPEGTKVLDKPPRLWEA